MLCNLVNIVISKASGDEDGFELKLTGKRLKALKGPSNSQEKPTLSIIDYIDLSLIKSKQRHNSELSPHRITVFIIELIFGKSPLKVVE